jgi:hypothetical protein
MVSSLLLASLLAATPTKPAKPSPEERLETLDDARLELHFGLRGDGRFLDLEPAYGGSVQLGAGVRLVRGLYLTGEIGAGAHAMPFGASGQVVVGLRHELRMSRWVRPTFSLGYSHLVDVAFDAALEADCGCFDWHGDDDDRHGIDLDARSDVEVDQRSGLQAGLGLRFPMRWAPRLSVYVRGDVAYYFDREPARLQAGGGGGLQIVF